jgi:hypothetical protein
VLAEHGGTVNIAKSTLSGNHVAVQAQSGSHVRLSDNFIADNGTAFGCGGGELNSAFNNHLAGNGASGCVPNFLKGITAQ